MPFSFVLFAIIMIHAGPGDFGYKKSPSLHRDGQKKPVVPPWLTLLSMMTVCRRK
jgi:hypothetical protein